MKPLQPCPSTLLALFTSFLGGFGGKSFVLHLKFSPKTLRTIKPFLFNTADERFTHSHWSPVFAAGSKNSVGARLKSVSLPFGSSAPAFDSVAKPSFPSPNIKKPETSTCSM